MEEDRRYENVENATRDILLPICEIVPHVYG